MISQGQKSWILRRHRLMKFQNRAARICVLLSLDLNCTLKTPQRYSGASQGSASGKESTCQCWRFKRMWAWSLVGKTSWRRKWQTPPVFLPGEFHRQRSLEGYGPWGHKESDMTEGWSTQRNPVGVLLPPEGLLSLYVVHLFTRQRAIWSE